ncbi:helix-turn-helix domain-containing protein [Actinomycetota bacterium Odt1-20B]
MSDDDELAVLLQALKERCGRSYTALARRTGLSRSSVHRYCLGLTVPGSFGTVEAVARACGADQRELDRLYRAWARADARREADARQDDPGTPEGQPGTSVTESAPPVAPPRPRRGRPARRLLGAGVGFLLVVAALAGSVAYQAARHDSKGDGAVSGRATDYWADDPIPVPAAYVGMTMNSHTGAMPGFGVGSVRLWESDTRWATVEAERGRPKWTYMEDLVRGARKARLPVLFTFGGTPRWAAPGGRRSAYGDSLASPPHRMADWDRFVREVATRFKGRIDAYELWDNVASPSHYAGSPRTLATMVRHAAGIIESIDPGATVVCPSIGRLWEAAGQDFLRAFMRAEGYRDCDVAAFKLHPRRADGPPEEIIELAARARRILYEKDLGIPIWNTGPGKDVATVGPLGPRRGADYAVRFYLAGLYSRFYDVERMYFYSWGSTAVPVVVQTPVGPPTEAARRIGLLRGWLAGASVTDCGRGAKVRLPGDAYECRFERGQERFAIRWTASGGEHAVAVPLGAGARRVRTLDGAERAARPGERLRFGEEPVLVTYRKIGNR